MAQKLNTEFNYRTQVVGETVWEKIKTLRGFLVGRKRAVVLEDVARLKYQAKVEKLRWLKAEGHGPLHIQLELEAELMELDSHAQDLHEAYRLNEQEIEILERLLEELYAEAEPTRIPGYTDEQMFEANAANEFTVWVAKEIHAEIIAQGRPSPAKLRNAMSCPQAWEACKAIGLIPQEALVLVGSVNPLKIELSDPLMIGESK
ncbi:MAG: hypothetical protein V4641_03425 [Pseudomonadota bacterium]